MGRHQHDFVWTQVEQAAGTLICFRIWLVMLPQVGAENEVPRESGELPQPDHERNIGVGQWPKNVTRRQPLHPLAYVRPRPQSPPCISQLIKVFGPETANPEARYQAFQALPVQRVQG